jgi:hypothetical protein
MPRLRHGWWFVALALLTLSCASANKLAQKSERELAAGDLTHAYEHALAAVRKKSDDPRARSAYRAAATRLVADREARVRAVAGADTIAAARLAMELSDLRDETSRYGVSLWPDADYAKTDADLRIGAARICYAMAEDDLAQRRPKAAYGHFREAAVFAPGYRDVARRIDETYTQALSRYAILPLVDQVDVDGLSRAMADHLYTKILPHIRPDGFRFTRLVEPGRVYREVTIADLDDMESADAMRIGRRVGADRVLIGRIYGLRARTDSREYRQSIFRHTVERDSSGSHDRYVETEFHARTRDREVTIHYDLRIVDAVDGTTLGNYSDAVTSFARVVFTDFQPQGDCDDYCLVPPDLKSSDSRRAGHIQEAWKDQFGNWTLPALLEQAKKDRNHSRYVSGDRNAFFHDCHEHPVWLGELPSEDEMAYIALDVIWQPALGMLQELDAK